jgi:starch synthase
VVRETGGLYDSIKPFGAGGNGFTFNSRNPYDLLYVIHEALETYKNREVWESLMKKAATTDFSWLRSAEDYKVLYENTFHAWN